MGLFDRLRKSDDPPRRQPKAVPTRVQIASERSVDPDLVPAAEPAVVDLDSMSYAGLVECLGEASERYVLASIEHRGATRIAELSVGLPSFDEHLSGMEDAGNSRLAAWKWMSAVCDHTRLAAGRAEPVVVRAVSEAQLSGFESGSYSIVLESTVVSDGAYEEDLENFVFAYAVSKLGVAPAQADELCLRVANVAPTEILVGVSLADAVVEKETLDSLGLLAKVVEKTPRSAGSQRRQTIPETVRHEVWRRDEGRCVDCGSRERLEFDHIIPVSKGGSNTVRNLELRCEECNRRKGATI